MFGAKHDIKYMCTDIALKSILYKIHIFDFQNFDLQEIESAFIKIKYRCTDIAFKFDS